MPNQESLPPEINLADTPGILALVDSDQAFLEQVGLRRQDLAHGPAKLDLAALEPIEEKRGVAIMGLIDAGSGAVKVCTFRGSDGKLLTDTMFLAAGDEDPFQEADENGHNIKKVFMSSQDGPRIFGRNQPGAEFLDLDINTVSSKHFSIGFGKKGKLTIEDLNSTNGTKLITRTQPETGNGRSERILQAAKRAGRSLVGRQKPEKPDAKPEHIKPEQAMAGLALDYETPESQIDFEVQLLRDYKRRFPKSRDLLSYALKDIDELTVVSSLMLKMPQELSEAGDTTHDVGLRSRALISTYRVTLVDGKLPADTHALLEGIYGLTGAKVIRKSQSEAGNSGHIWRQGQYHGKDLQITENYGEIPNHPGQTVLNVTLQTQV